MGIMASVDFDIGYAIPSFLSVSDEDHGGQCYSS
jgi:hypothetical protein